MALHYRATNYRVTAYKAKITLHRNERMPQIY